MLKSHSEIEAVKHESLPSRAWAVFLLVLALVYFVSPVDLLPDPIYLDDVIALLATLAKVYTTFRRHRLARRPIEIEPVTT